MALFQIQIVATHSRRCGSRAACVLLIRCAFGERSYAESWEDSGS